MTRIPLPLYLWDVVPSCIGGGGSPHAFHNLKFPCIVPNFEVENSLRGPRLSAPRIIALSMEFLYNAVDVHLVRKERRRHRSNWGEVSEKMIGRCWCSFVRVAYTPLAVQEFGQGCASLV